MVEPRGRTDVRNHGADDTDSWWRHAGVALLGYARHVTADRNGFDVPIDERLPPYAVAQTHPPLATRHPGVVTRNPNERAVRSTLKEKTMTDIKSEGIAAPTIVERDVFGAQIDALRLREKAHTRGGAT
jgi:hypothetical protein